MSESAQAQPQTQPIPASGLALPAVLERYAFALGVAGIAAVVAAFLFHQLLAWAPHEDETLALFVGRQPLDELFRLVLAERGGAPLHFLLAWVVAHLGFGLGGLRTLSAIFALGSLPLVALLGARLAGRRQALVATALVGTSWAFLFHGVYGRMYGVFLFTSALSYLALLVALERGDRRGWSLWVLAVLLTVAAHPYGALVLATQGAYVVLARRDRLRQAVVAAGAIVLLGIPFWLTNLVLADRFEVGVGGGGERLGGPWPVARYLWRVLGDFTSGWWPVTLVALVLVAVGLRRLPRRTAVLFACVLGVPALAFVAARLGSATSPETRHLIFALPFVALAVAAGILRFGRLAPIAFALLVVAQVAWAWERTPQLFEWEPDARQAARAEASAYLAATSRPDDILFGYEPLYLGAWERNPDFPLTVLPRADAKLALATLQELERPLGRGVWVLDASANNNIARALEIDWRSPEPASAYDVRRFGPFLVIRTSQPTLTAERYLRRAGNAMLVGKALYIGDADINLLTVERAARDLRGYGRARSLSTSSR
jgi:Dolichyl-phosphate-mannose-protein mannosyltransferase